MKAHVALFILVATFPGCSVFVRTPSPSQTASNPEDGYFKSRDDFIQQFANASGTVDYLPALSELEKQMREIVGPVNVEGFPREGKISLESLIKGELGFDQADGLVFGSSHEILFVTTNRALKRYLADSPDLPNNLAELSRTGEFYSRAFMSDIAVTPYVELPVKSMNETSYAHAFLASTAQDIGPIVPDGIFVFVSTGSRIFAVYSHATIAIKEIPACRSEWEIFEKKRSEAFEAYRSGLKAYDDSERYEEQGFEAYHRCYDREARNQAFFEPIQKQAQSIVDRLQRSRTAN